LYYKVKTAREEEVPPYPLVGNSFITGKTQRF